MLFGKLFTNPKMWVNGNANEITMGGVYTCKDVQNVPTGDGALLVFKTENTVKQVFVPVGEEGVVYTRVLGEDWSSVSGTSEETEALIQSAIDKANTVDTRLNNIIVESGTSDAEVVAARTDSEGQTFTTLGVRLDTQFGDIKEDLTENNSYNIFDAYGKYSDGTSQGATLTWNNDHVGTITRADVAGSATVFGTILGGTNEIPVPLVKGETYTIQSNITDDNVLLQIMEYRENNSSASYVKGTVKYTVPNDIDGVVFRILVRKDFSGTATIRVKMLNAPTNKMLTASIGEGLSTVFNSNIGTITLNEYTDKSALINGAIDKTGTVTTSIPYADTSRYFDYMTLDANATNIKVELAVVTTVTNFYIYVNFYDDNKIFLSRSGSGERPYITIADIPANARYMRVSFTQITNSTLGDSNIVSVGVTQYIKKGIYNGKKLYIVGDSISAGYVSMFKSDADERGLYVQYTAPVENEGQVVCSVWDRSGTLSYWGQANDVWGMDMNNLSAPGKGYLRVSSTDSKSGVEVIRDTSFEDADVIIIALGFNDWHYKISRGNHDLIDANVPYPTEGYDTTLLTTYNQAIWYAIGEIVRKAPNARLVVQTPMNGWAYGGDFSTNWGIEYALENSGTLADVHDDIVYWCNYYGVQYLDMTYNNSVVNRVNIKKTIIDGSHPSEAAHRTLGLYVSGLL